ncbi:MAG TPA: CBS domain-containing protein [Mycobacteriales bacterium]|nr:CBS domain-containing protein [Mycobacteriales bacterium]
MLVSDLIRRKGSSVASAPPDTTVAALLDLLAEHGIGAVVVSGDGSTVSGIVSERDVVRALRRSGPALLDTPVSELMTTDVVVAAPADTVEDLMRLMTERRIRHVPVVVSEGRMAGIISIGDVVKSRIEALEADREQLIDYIQSSG